MKIIKKIIPLLLTIVVVIYGYRYFIQNINNYEINNLYNDTIQHNHDVLNQNGINISDDKIKSVYEAAHKMTNGLIRADEIWNIIAMDKKNINKLYVIVKDTNLPDKQIILSIIDRWKKGNFSNIVQDHNYFWNLLNGTVGEAYGRNEKAIRESINEITNKR